MPTMEGKVLKGASKTAFDEDGDDNGRVMKLAIIFMTVLDLFPVLIPNENVNFDTYSFPLF